VCSSRRRWPEVINDSLRKPLIVGGRTIDRWNRLVGQPLPGLRLVPAPGHTRGMQVVVVETGGRPVVVGGDVAVWFGELDEPQTEGQLRVRALDPELVWLAHEHEPWRSRNV
jgi:glyoxylase-like metal-dependent hydrolase (beta-lactamase superfamily II)